MEIEGTEESEERFFTRSNGATETINAQRGTGHEAFDGGLLRQSNALRCSVPPCESVASVTSDVSCLVIQGAVMKKIAVAVMIVVASGALMSAQQPKSFYD